MLRLNPIFMPFQSSIGVLYEPTVSPVISFLKLFSLKLLLFYETSFFGLFHVKFSAFLCLILFM